MHFLRQLRSAFADHASRPALEHRGDVLSFGALDALATRGGNWLRSLGVDPGERVAICTGEKRAHLIACLAAWYAGGIPLPLNPRCPRPDLRYLLTDSGARVAIAGPEQWGVIDELRQ